jgi:hypothetical protein
MEHTEADKRISDLGKKNSLCQIAERWTAERIDENQNGWNVKLR